MTKFFRTLSERLARLHPVAFVYLFWFMTYAALLPLVLLNSVIDNDALRQTGGPQNLIKASLVWRLIIGSIIGPLFETAIFQWLPIRIMRVWMKLPALAAIVVSAALFGAGHTYSIGYVVYTFVIGLVFAYGFTVRDYPGGRPFLLIFVIHALRNAVTSLLI